MHPNLARGFFGGGYAWRRAKRPEPHRSGGNGRGVIRSAASALEFGPCFRAPCGGRLDGAVGRAHGDTRCVQPHARLRRGGRDARRCAADSGIWNRRVSAGSGVLIALAVRLPRIAATAIVCVFAVVHGHPHAAEIAAIVNPLGYALGSIAASIALNACGLLLVRIVVRQQSVVARGWRGVRGYRRWDVGGA
jgi:HupE / UreJ protein